MDSSISTTKKGIFEFVLLGLVESMLKLIKSQATSDCNYTLTKLFLTRLI